MNNGDQFSVDTCCLLMYLSISSFFPVSSTLEGPSDEGSVIWDDSIEIVEDNAIFEAENVCSSLNSVDHLIYLLF